MKSIGPVYKELISNITTSRTPLVIPFFSSVTGQATYDGGLLGPEYWKKNMEDPVLFLSAVESALQNAPEFGSALELGPHSALSGPFRQICKAHGKIIMYSSCLSRGLDTTTTVLSAVGQLYCQGIMPDFAAMNPGGTTLSNLPPYPWTHETAYWNESRISREFRTRAFPEHELLGARVIGGNDVEPSWRKMLSLKEVPWLADHVVANHIVFPAAGYVAMAGEAIRQLFRSSSSTAFSVRALSIASTMLLQTGRPTEIMTRLQPHRLTDSQDSTWFDFCIMSHDGNRWTRHCSGQVHVGNVSTPSTRGMSSSIPEGKREVDSTKWYQAAKSVGLEYGPAFQGMQHISYDLTRSCTVATLRPTQQSFDFFLHPTTVDQLLQCSLYGRNIHRKRRKHDPSSM